MKKRILSAFLCLCMMLTLAPAAFAAGETGSDSGNNAPSITAATLHDTSGAVKDNELYTGDYIATQTYQEDANNANVFTSAVTITVKDLKKHQNADDPASMGYWTGFFVTMPAETKMIKYAYSETPTTETPVEHMKDKNGNTLDGIAFYFNREVAETGKCSVEFLGEATNGTAPTLAKVVYTVDLKGVEIYTEEKPDPTPTTEYTIELKPRDEKVAYNIQVGTKNAADSEDLELTFTGTIAEAAFSEPAAAPVAAEAETKKTAEAVLTFTPKTTGTGDDSATVRTATDPITINTILTWDGADKVWISSSTALPTGYVLPAQDGLTGIKVTTDGKPEPAVPTIKSVTASLESAVGEEDTVELTAEVDDANKQIKISGQIPAAKFENGKTRELKLTYTCENVDNLAEGGTYYGILSDAGNGKVSFAKKDTSVTFPLDYAINVDGISVLEVAATPGENKTEVDKTAIPEKDNQDKAQETAEQTADAIPVDEIIANAQDTLKTVADSHPDAEIKVFVEVKATGYNVTDGKVTSVKLDITPKYEAKKDGAVVASGDIPTLTKEIKISVPLPQNFVNTSNVRVKHSKGNTFIEWINAIIKAGNVEFYTKGFSEYEVVADERTVTVKYNGTTATTKTLTAANINKALDTDSKEGYDFKGWATKENATTAEYSGNLTSDMLDKMITAANGSTLNLYPVFEKTGSSDNPSSPSGSGGGGGNKRPNSSNNNNNTTTPTTPSDYGNNPSTPSTPSTPVSSTGFSDVAAGGWYESAVQYMKDNGLMAGTSATTFAPDATTTRGMIVTILYRLEKEPEAAASTFSDIAAGEWYSNAVAWAAANNIVSGYENGTFGANDVITREQMAAILFRYASFKGYDVTKTADISSFADAAQVSAYAADAMKWANAAGLISGTSATTLAPTGSATRAQAAPILMRFCENVAK